MNRNLEALLRWGVENSQRPEDSQGAGTSTAVAPVQDTSAPAASAGASGPAAGSSANKLDPGILDAIMGKSDAQRMMDCVTDLKSPGKYNLEQRLHIWDELELLVENMDNANDLTNMKLWQPITDFLDDENEEMRLQACWVLGTAIQNNPKSQTAFLELDPLPRLLELLQSDLSAEMRSKAMYTISGVLRHNPPAVVRFTTLGGWAVLEASLRDPSVALRRKAAFLVHSLFMNTVADAEARSYNVAAQQAGIHGTLIDSLSIKSAIPVGQDGEIEDIDIDYSEKAINALVSITNKAGEGSTRKAFTKEQQEQLKTLLKELENDQRVPSDLSQKEWIDFTASVQAA